MKASTRLAIPYLFTISSNRQNQKIHPPGVSLRSQRPNDYSFLGEVFNDKKIQIPQPELEEPLPITFDLIWDLPISPQ